VLEIEKHPLGVGLAVTLGRVIIYFGEADPNEADKRYGSPDNLILRLHEHGHVQQGDMLGPLYIPTYFALGGWWDDSNPMEQDANAYARYMRYKLDIYDIYNKPTQ
jgi:hypothetical protein